MKILGIDIGGTGIKGAIVDTKTGELISERLRIPTPQPATPKNVSNTLKTFIKEFEWVGPVGVSFPTITKNGKAIHFGNLDPSWRSVQVDTLFKISTGNDYYVVNDADAAAMGVMEFGIVWATLKRAMTQTIAAVIEVDLTLDTIMDQQTQENRRTAVDN